MTTEVFKEMKDFSIGELEQVISMANKELTRRRNEEREKLITDFRKAWGRAERCRH